MAKFRKVHTTFWDDPYIEKLSAEDRYFYLFLLTNPLCSECGIYPITIKKMSYWTGYTDDAIRAILKRFIADKRIVYDTSTNEICILHKPKYIDKLGKPVIDCLVSELASVKSKDLIIRQLQFVKHPEIRYVYDTYTIRGQEEEKEKEKEKEENKKGDESFDSFPPSDEYFFFDQEDPHEIALKAKLFNEEEKEKSSAKKEKENCAISEPSGLEASASLVDCNSQTVNTGKEEKVLTQAEKFEKIISDIFNQSAISNYSDEYKKLWIALCKSPKWKKKTKFAFELAIKQLSKYDEPFGIKLMEKSISGNYQGIVFDNTDEKYQEYLKKKLNNGSSTFKPNIAGNANRPQVNLNKSYTKL